MRLFQVKLPQPYFVLERMNIMANKKLKIFSFFSGCGFLDLGFEKSGYEIVLVNEYFKPFLDAYKYARVNMGMLEPAFGYWNTDINRFLTDDKSALAEHIEESRRDGSLVGFIGGPPCPDFSIAGKNKGKEGENGKLSRSYADLIIATKPDFFLFENVKGLWRTARHREFFEDLKEDFVKAGYILANRLTNSLEYGVPQDRDRILLIGIKKILLPDICISGNEISNFPWEKHQRYTVDDVKRLSWPETTQFGSDSKLPEGLPEELTVQYWFNKNDVENHPNSNCYFTPRSGLERMQNIEEGDVSRKSYKRLHRWRYSPTVAYGNNEVHLHPTKARRLSVAEALSLQSLPKEFILPPDMSLSHMFKTVGNGVPYLLSKGIATTLREYLEKFVL